MHAFTVQLSMLVGYTKRKMFSATMVGLLAAVSSAAWVYTWTMRRTGSNTKSAVTTAGIVALMVFVVVVTVVATIDSMLKK